jgi:hypothetical protein
MGGPGAPALLLRPYRAAEHAMAPHDIHRSGWRRLARNVHPVGPHPLRQSGEHRLSS